MVRAGMPKRYLELRYREMNADRFDSLEATYQAIFEQRNLARERALALCRRATRSCSKAIRAVHRLEFADATRLIAESRDLIEELKLIMAPHPEVLYTGFFQDAQKEYAEASLTFEIITKAQLSSHQELDVDAAVYLNGLGEAAGELRRYVLDRLRQGNIEECERVLVHMEEIYGLLVTIDYPDGLTRGLRRTTDMVRGVLERTRGDFTVAVRQSNLEAELRRATRI